MIMNYINYTTVILLLLFRIKFQKAKHSKILE